MFDYCDSGHLPVYRSKGSGFCLFDCQGFLPVKEYIWFGIYFDYVERVRFMFVFVYYRVKTYIQFN